MANATIGVKGWRNYSSFSPFASGSQRADKQTSMMVDTCSGNCTVMSTDWNLAARVPCSLSRAYNHLDATTGVDRPFGPGWTWQFDMNLTGDLDCSSQGDVTWKSADGSEYVFAHNASGGGFDFYTSPYGLKGPVALRRDQSTGDWNLFIGKQQLYFEVNTTDNVARLMWIQDTYGTGSYQGNRLIIDRVLDGNAQPTATFNCIQIGYTVGGGTWVTHSIVEPTYTSDLITMLRLLDTVSGSDYLDLHYSYTTIDGASRLTKVEPKFGSTGLNMEIEYDYNATATKGLELTKVYDTNGSKAGTPYYWTINYTSDKVSSIVFPIASGDTGTVNYAYGQGAPTDWNHSSPSTWTKLSDANSNDWYYGLDSNGRVQFALDPLWVHTSHESYIEYSYNDNNQVTSVKTPYPNAESGQNTTLYFYNSSHQLEVVQDHYGFLTFYKYGSRGSYSHTGSGATVQDVIGVFTPRPNQQAYADNDHTSPITDPPSDPTISLVQYDSTDEWHYHDDRTAPDDVVQLVRTVIDYRYIADTGRLAYLLTCSPENFKDTAESYTLTTLSDCSCMVFGAIESGYYPPSANITVTSGDLMRSYTPTQFKVADNSLGYTAFTYDEVFGVMTEVENADSIVDSAGRKTLHTYNKTKTRVVKVQQPEDNANQWTVMLYDGATTLAASQSSTREFQTGVMRPDIDSWGIPPIVSITEYDYNGNATKSWQADPEATGTRWDGNTAHGYDEVGGRSYDRINRIISSYQKVDWNQDSTVDTLTTTYTYDDNGNLLYSKGPSYLTGVSTYNNAYNFTDYDDANRALKSYVQVASESAITTPPANTPYTGYEYDLAGNVIKVTEPLYDSNTSTVLYASFFTYDWMNRRIKTSRDYTNPSSTVVSQVTEQHFSADGGVWWSADGEGYKHHPEYDDNGRLVKTYRGTRDSGDADLRKYDADGRVEYAWSYQDVADSPKHRLRNVYDEMGRLVNSGRERELMADVWLDWNCNTADTTFNYNGAVLRTFDKVNANKFTERVYDNWGQTVTVTSPAVPDPANPETNKTYDTNYAHDVLGRQTSVEDHMDNTTTYTFDLLGRTIEVEDAKNYTTATYYDARGNRWKVITSGGAEYYYTYNDRGQLERERVSHDSQDDDTGYTYDANGRTTRIDYPDGGATTYGYDELGRKTSSGTLIDDDPSDVFLTTAYEYDDDNRMTKLTLPGGYTYEYTYDDLGNRTQSTDTADNVTDFTYDLNNRQLTNTSAATLVRVVNVYDWKTGAVDTVRYATVEGSPLAEVTILSYNKYTFNNNGQVTEIKVNVAGDGTGGETWTKGYDAMGRMTTLTTPTVGATAYTHTITYDGNNMMVKTVDFKTGTRYYKYDELNRMTGHGVTSLANDETYAWACCRELTAFTDGFGTASISYDDLGRQSSFTDTQGLQVQYEYDSRGRTAKVTPPQGSSYRTEYQYNIEGTLKKVRVYDAATYADTDYVYSTTTGKLTQRDFPTESSQHIRTSYTYDSAGRLSCETVTREAGGTTNLSRTNYTYAYSTAGHYRELIQEEELGGGGWINSNQVTYRYDGMERLNYEKREEWLGDPTPAYVQVYLIAQEYDKKGNRTRFNKDVTSGHTDSYGKSMDLSYTYNAMNALSVITDADDAYYGCAVTCDANNNITAVTESVTTGGYSATLYTSFGYDWANRMQYSQVRAFDGTQKDWQLTKREHGYDAAGRLVNSTYKQWWEEDEEPTGDSVEHAYAGSKHVQNFDGDASYGAVWHWAGAQNSFAAPVKSPNPDTAARDAYNIANATTPQRKTWQSPTTAGDQRNLFGQGQPMAKDSSGAGADWSAGIASYTTEATVLQIESRLDFDGTVAPTDLDRATDAREKGRIGIFGSALSYAGNSGRVTSEPIGRDLNPLGRGDGYGYMAGALNVGKIAPRLPLSRANRGSGFSINNSDQKDPNPGASGDTGGGRPGCCDCYTWPCCGMVGAVGGPGFGGKNSCCCPLGCSTEMSTCVGDGGIDDCGAVCEIEDDENPCAEGDSIPPSGGSGGGCSGCGGGGGQGVPGNQPAYYGHTFGAIGLPGKYSQPNRPLSIRRLQALVMYLGFPGECISLAARFHESNHHVLSMLMDEEGDVPKPDPRIDTAGKLINCLKRLSEIWKAIKNLRTITVDQLEQLLDMEDCCIVVRDLICVICGGSDLVKDSDKKNEVANFCVCCGEFDADSELVVRGWGTVQEDPILSDNEKSDCFDCFSVYLPTARRELFEGLAECLKDKIIPDFVE